ncbi:subtilisin-like protein [Rozella allomycis CSF55]|uniref:Subtilisin-like protein n=1 Tax=Rozella allomycis (strain CSF55) TaxID=988480 RepID=A0A4P9YFQ8_ROZAC|nr:subtilisin-like protein [Rozella allomycis CSF55]
MKCIVFLALAVLALARHDIIFHPGSQIIPGRYIVSLKHDDVSTAAVEEHHKWIQSVLEDHPESTITHVYNTDKLKGYAGTFNDQVLEKLRHNDAIEYIEHDQVVTVGMYIPKHMKSSNRVRLAVRYLEEEIVQEKDSFFPRQRPSLDGVFPEFLLAQFQKHMETTHTQSLLAMGLIGSMSGVVGGIEWVVKEHLKNPKAKSVASMSLGGGRSPSLDRAVDVAVKKGVHFAVAAGNENQDACNTSPAASQYAITVGATDRHDKKAWFSNFGECVNIHAPGVDIASAWIGDTDAVNVISGTSMATPHVAGVLALYLAIQDLNPTQLKKQLVSDSTKDVIKGLPKRTINALLNTNELFE